jgi:addiction module RelE/StbE family toxin
MKILYTRQSINDLKRLRDFLAKDNLKAAKEAPDRLIQAVRRLIDFPSLGRQVKDCNDSLAIRDLVTGRYIIRYVVLKDEIHILRIWHGKEDRFNV